MIEPVYSAGSDSIEERVRALLEVQSPPTPSDAAKNRGRERPCSELVLAACMAGESHSPEEQRRSHCQELDRGDYLRAAHGPDEPKQPANPRAIRPNYSCLPSPRPLATRPPTPKRMVKARAIHEPAAASSTSIGEVWTSFDRRVARRAMNARPEKKLLLKSVAERVLLRKSSAIARIPSS